MFILSRVNSPDPFYSYRETAEFLISRL